MLLDRCAGAWGRLPRRAIAASGGLVVSSAVLQGGLFVATVLVARELGRAQLGRYATAIAIGLLIVSGAGGGMPVLALREVAAGRADRAFLSRIMRIEFCVTSAATVAAAFAGMAVLGGMSGLLLGGAAGLGNIGLAQLSLLSSVHAGLHQFRTAAIWQGACGIAIAMLTWLALLSGRGILAALLAIVVASFICLAGLYVGLSRPLVPTGPVDNSRLFRRSLVFLGMGLIYGGYQRVDTLLVYAIGGPSAAGLYASAYRLLSPFRLLGSGFSTVFFARLSAAAPGQVTNFRALQRRGSVLLPLALLPVAAAALIFMPLLITTAYGSGFSDAITPARILLLSLLPYALYLPLALTMNAVGRESALFRILLLSTLLEIVLVSVLTPRYGATGAAAAWVLTELMVLFGLVRGRSLMFRTVGAPTQPRV